MKMLVLGGGLQGSACAYDLLQNPAVQSVRLADLEPDAMPPFLEKYRTDSRLERVRLDASKGAELAAVMQGVDSCMNALPYYFNLAVTKAAVAAGVHCCDLGGNTEIVFQQMELHDQAVERGASVVPDCGLAPGMVNILAAAGIEKLDEPTKVRIYVGGLPQNPEPPLNYQLVYSLHGVLDYYTTRSWVLREGRPQEVEALTEVEPIEFPEPVGQLEAFHTAGGLSTMPWSYEGQLDSMEYKTLRYPGHADLMRAVRALGLLETEPVEVDGQRVVPRDAFIASAEPRLTKPESRDLVALRVEVTGQLGGREQRVRYDLVDYRDESTGITAMERTTGFSLSITGQLQAGGAVEPGVRTPDQAMPAQRYIDELRTRGIDIRESVGPTG